MKNVIRYVRIAIEDIAFPSRSLRVTLGDVPILSAMLY
jgi:hypothetical protein